MSNQAGKIYGRSLTTDDFSRIERQLQTAEDLRLYDLIGLVTGEGMDGSDALVNDLVLQHESQAYGIEPTADEIKDAEMKTPGISGGQTESLIQRNTLPSWMKSSRRAASATRNSMT